MILQPLAYIPRTMKRTLGIIVLALLLAPASTASAQLLAAKDGPIVNGHTHLNASNLEEHKKFWAGTLGGVAEKVGTNNLEIVKFPNVLLFFRPGQKPTGGTKGTTVDHIGFSVPNLRQALDKVKAGGYRVVTAVEAPAGIEVKDDIGQVNGGGVTGIAYVMGPDDVKVELVEMKAQTAPIVSHHIHFFSPQQAEMHAWYIKVFGAKARPGAAGTFIGADLPGVGLNVSQATTPVISTRGRAIDHIGFEVKNLEAFTKSLEAQGIKIDVSYRRIEALNTAIAFIADPWGTLIELSEGLDKIP